MIVVLVPSLNPDVSPASNEAVATVGTTPAPTGGGITGFRGTGPCDGYISPPVGDGWTGCHADVFVNVAKVSRSGYVSAFLYWACTPSDCGHGYFHGDVRVTAGSTPGSVTIPTKSTYLQRSACSNAIPVIVEIYDGPQGGTGAPLLYSGTFTWTGFGCG